MKTNQEKHLEHPRQARLATLLVTGGLQREFAADLPPLSGQHLYRARLTRVDMGQGTECTVMDHESPPETRPDDTPGIRFTCMSHRNARLYLCTGTEMLIHEYPSMKRIGYASHPHFHDIHHTAPIGEEIAVVSTGLDMVIFLDPETMAPKRYFNASSEDVWYRFDENDDYRKFHTTQPHDSHPNFIFTMNGEPWVSRCNKGDIMSLKDRRTIHLSETRFHDGVARNGLLYFTAVDGRVLVVNEREERLEETIDLRDIENTDLPLGWCRGLCFDGDVAYVGYSVFRRTDQRQNVSQFLDSNGQYIQRLPTRICAYDFAAKTKLGEYIFPDDSLGVMFNMMLEKDVTTQKDNRHAR